MNAPSQNLASRKPPSAARSSRASRTARTAILGALVMITVASCSSGDASGPGTEPPVTAAPTTTEADEVPSTPPAESTTTTSLATTTTSTATPTTTESPAETNPPDPLSAQAAEDEVQRLFGLTTECFAAMPNCDPAEVASNYADGLQQVTLSQFTIWADGGYTIANSESRVIRIDSSTVEPGAALASVFACEDSGAVLIDNAGNVVDDLYESKRTQWFLKSDGIRWVANGRAVLEVVSGEENTLCDA